MSFQRLPQPMVQTTSFTYNPMQPQAVRGMANVRKTSFERVRAPSFERTQERKHSIERVRAMQQGQPAPQQHSYKMPEAQRGQGGYGYPGMEGMAPYDAHDAMADSGFAVDGSQLMNGSELDMRNATQLGGVLSSLTGGSMFLKQSLDGDTVNKRANMIPRHDNSSFASRNYTVIKELGRGSFSRVQLLRDRRSGVARVMKISEGGMGTKQSGMLKNEIHLLSALDHPNIVKIYECSEDLGRGQLLMVLEYVGGGDCQQLLRSSAKAQSEALIAKLMYQLLSVLCYSHARGILHCDIKPENMMITQPSSKGLPELKVIDFGLTHRIDQPSRDFVGTPSYMAPEIVKGTVAFTIKADIWSAGVTACELLASQAPFDRPQDYKGNVEPVLQNIRDYRNFKQIDERLSRSEFWASRGWYARDFVEGILIADPADRPHADQALEHAWLEKYKVAPSSLSTAMYNSMVRFMGASNLMRRCLLIIAARVGSPKMEQVGPVFLSIDDRHTGNITREDLAAAVSAAVTCWEPEFDVDDFFDAADQDQKDTISFLEFSATCLWGPDDTTATIAERAFKALDDNHDGMIHLDDCRLLFRNCDLPALRNLPRNRPFGIEEWRAAIGCNNDQQQPRKQQPDSAKSMLAGFIRTLMCSQDEPGHVDDRYDRY